MSAAPLEDFAGEGAEARMQDVEWLAPRALWHERVIEQVARFSPVLPAGLGTLFSSSARLTELMGRHHDRILGFLDRVEGHDEWAVKGFLDRRKAVAALLAATREASQAGLSSSPGTRYMQEQRIRSQAETGLERWLAATLERIREELVGHASDFVERTVLALESDELPGQMVANWAFLVPRGAAAELRARVRQLDEELEAAGLRLQDSGAWPPYSFTPALGEREAAETSEEPAR